MHRTLGASARSSPPRRLRPFQRSLRNPGYSTLALAIEELSLRFCEELGIRQVVLSGGVFQNGLLLATIKDRFEAHPGLEIWVNREVPPNDGGISLGQAALGAIRAVDAA